MTARLTPVRSGQSAQAESLFEILQGERLVLLVFTGQQEPAAVVGLWQEVVALVSAGYQALVEPYLVTTPAISASEHAANQTLQDDAGRLHHQYASEQGGLVLIRPDGYIGFRSPFGAAEPPRRYLHAILRT